MGVVAPEQGLAHAQRTLLVLQRLFVLAQFVVRYPNVAERLSNVGVVALEQGLAHAQSALQVLQRLFVLAQFSYAAPTLLSDTATSGWSP